MRKVPLSAIELKNFKCFREQRIDLGMLTVLSGLTVDVENVYSLESTDMAEQVVSSLAVMALPSGQAQPDREALPVDDRMDFGRETASGTIETMISIPLLAVAACWWARTEVLSIIWMSLSCAAVKASIIRPQTPAFRQRTKRL